MVRSVSPLMTGNGALLGEMEKAENTDALEQFVASRNSFAIRRFLELAEAAHEATQAALVFSRPPLSAGEYIPEIKQSLAKLCVFAKEKNKQSG
jgi:hypothetical protein